MFICSEKTSDGTEYFTVDSKETFDALMELNNAGTNEAEEWGGIEFDVFPGSAITMKVVEEAKEKNGLNASDFDPDDELAEDAYEAAYMWARG